MFFDDGFQLRLRFFQEQQSSIPEGDGAAAITNSNGIQFPNY